MQINNKDDFKKFSKEFQSTHEMPFAFAVGQPFYDTEEKLLAVRWLSTNVYENLGFLASVMHVTGHKKSETPVHITLTNSQATTILDEILHPFNGEEGHKNLKVLAAQTANAHAEQVIIIIYPTEASLTEKGPIDHLDALCRLTMISNLKFKPNELNLDNMLDLLLVLVYTPTDVLTENQYEKECLKGNYIHVLVKDKIPPYTWGAQFPDGVRVADPSRIRLGAHLAPGTTVMHEGDINFNAGTLGPCMVEGRISARVTVGANSDIGGGASIMGTLSGGGTHKVSIGENCLVGANAGIGISLGDRCTIEAGLYLTAGKKVRVTDKRFPEYPNWIKASVFSGRSDMLFIQNSRDGAVELRWNNKPNKLNPSLHAGAKKA